MIIGNDIHPKREVYYLGGIVLSAFDNLPEGAHDFFSLYQYVNKLEQISITLFALTLDWLFLLELIDSKNGLIRKCF